MRQSRKTMVQNRSRRLFLLYFCIGGCVCLFVGLLTLFPRSGVTDGYSVTNSRKENLKRKGHHLPEIDYNMEDWKQYLSRRLHRKSNFNEIKNKFEEFTTEARFHRQVQKCTEREVRLSTKQLPVTGLVSFPGSGNTWTRHLIQQMTGIGTSSKYCDKSLLKNGFPFECYENKSRTIVVKTHTSVHFPSFQRIVLLLRNPFDALLSMVHFMIAGHTARPGVERLKQQMDEYFDDLVHWFIGLTGRINKHIHGPIYILQYEALKTNMAVELLKLAKFLDVNVSQHDIDCTVMLQEGHFHRKTNMSEHFDILKTVYSPEQLLTLRELARYSEKLIQRDFGVSLNIGGLTEQMLFHSYSGDKLRSEGDTG